MPDVLENDEIPFENQAQLLFMDSPEQQVVPFLGAGVSISGRRFPAAPACSPNYPDRQTLDSIFQQLGLNGQAKTFLEIAILLACRLQFSQSQPPAAGQDALIKKLQQDDYPPSAGELAQLFSQLSNFTRFKQVARLIKESLQGSLPNATDKDLIEMLKLLASESRIANPPDPLTSITGYYESTASDRTSLWNTLSSIGIGKKNTPSKTHLMLAAAAKHYLSQAKTFDDYLIITTNYDCLMETALDKLEVPYAVLVNRRSDQKILVRFSQNVPDAADYAQRNSGKSYPSHFMLSRPSTLVVLYKIHGCLNPDFRETDDGVIISDSDYINYISQMGTNEGVIPAYVSNLMQNKRFLFLGYSLSDWNVRSIFETLRRKRNPDRKLRDFAVTYRVDEYEKGFFVNNNVQIIRSDLNIYVDGIASYIPKALRDKLEELWGKPGV